MVDAPEEAAAAVKAEGNKGGKGKKKGGKGKR
jgi:hypothetical protein